MGQNTKTIISVLRFLRVSTMKCQCRSPINAHMIKSCPILTIRVERVLGYLLVSLYVLSINTAGLMSSAPARRNILPMLTDLWPCSRRYTYVLSTSASSANFSWLNPLLSLASLKTCPKFFSTDALFGIP
jgi:hypothetical protein